MLSSSATSSDSRPQGAEEKRSLSEEIIRAQAVLDEARRANAALDQRRARWTSSIPKLLGNGFVLLVAGALLSGILIPRFQRAQQQRAARIAARTEAVSQFLVYSNSRWQEYYLLPTLVGRDLGEAEYRAALQELTRIKIARYDAFAKLSAAALAYRRTPGQRNDVVEGALQDYAVRINELSRRIDAWLRNAYCYSNECIPAEDAPLDRAFDPYAEFAAIKHETVALLDLDSSVAALLTSHVDDD